MPQRVIFVLFHIVLYWLISYGIVPYLVVLISVYQSPRLQVLFPALQTP